MAKRVHLWWKEANKSLIVGALILFVVVVLIVLGYWFNWSWTGFGAETSEPKEHSKTLWDWLQLLIIPVVLAGGSIWFAGQQAKVNDAENTDNQHETALQTYIDKISEMLLKEDTQKAEVRAVARARTLTVLLRLDTRRKTSLMQFLCETQLISVLDLSGAHLNGVQLGKAKLNDAKLSEADLSGASLVAADLRRATLSNADLNNASLNKANLTDATMNGAYLDGAHLVYADLQRANLSGIYLGEANLMLANLRGANLRKATLSGACLIKVKLDDADLRGANFSRTAMEAIDGEGGPEVTFATTDLRGATLSGADLSEANLRGAIITDKQLKEAKSLQGAIMPDGSKHT